MVRYLDALHLRLRRSRWLARAVVATRILLAAAFIPTGLVKVLGQRFTSISVEHPVGAFFEALYRTGIYWQFLGWSQVIAGLLLLVPATATLGALLFLAIATNIVVITLALDFGGTPVVTVLMFVAVLGLVAWDYHRWRGVLIAGPAVEPPPLAPLRWAALERVLLNVGAAGGIAFFLGTRSLLPAPWPWVGLVSGLVSAVVIGGVWLAQDWPQRRA
jgi:hypothetical protein